jgi:hypothetical protein
MGYTVATPFPNETLRDEVAEFLKAEYRTWAALNGDPKGNAYSSPPLPDGWGHYDRGKNLDYDDGTCRIGFNYNTADGEREYVWTYCRWLALRFGEKQPFPNLKDPAPGVSYDGDDPEPVVINERYDEWGVKIAGERERRPGLELMLKEFEEDAAIIRAEMQRLDKAWAERGVVPEG